MVIDQETCIKGFCLDSHTSALFIAFILKVCYGGLVGRCLQTHHSKLATQREISSGQASNRVSEERERH